MIRDNSSEFAVPRLNDLNPSSFPTIRAWYLYVNHDSRLGLTVLLFILGGMFSFAPLLFLTPFIPYWIDGVRVQGTVTGRDPVACCAGQPVLLATIFAHGGRGRGPARFLKYEFRDGAGVLQHASARVDFDTWQRVQVGDEVEVVYLDNDPTKSKLWLGLNQGNTMLLVFGTIGLLALGSGVRTMFRALGGISKDIALWRGGTLTVGEVIEHSSEVVDKRSARLTLSHRYNGSSTFAGPKESYLGVYTTIGRAWFTGQTGDPLPVVYAKDEPERSTVDRFRLRGTGFELLLSSMEDHQSNPEIQIQ